MRLLIALSFIAVTPLIAFGQALDMVLTVTDNGGGTQTLHMGLDPSATDGLDAALGEAELPPSPPTGVFDARFVGDDISVTTLQQGSLRDYRQGSWPATSTSTKMHEVKYQVGTGTTITLNWTLPSGVSGQLQDVITGTVVNEAMNGTGNYTVTNPSGLSKLKITLTYGSNGGGTRLDIPLTVGDNGGATQTLHFGLDPAATDGIDTALAEAELPPSPPTGVFDARFVGDDISVTGLQQGSLRDYRHGSWPTVVPLTTVHEVKYQVGTGSTIMLSCTLPSGVSGQLQDVITGTVVNVAMSGTVDYTVTNPSGLSKLKITMTYVPSAVKESEGLPERYVLEQNYPNPFNPSTTIRYSLPMRSHVKLTVYSTLGQAVAELVNREVEIGYHEVTFNASQLSSGIYFYRIRAGEFIQTRKLVLIR
jgi:hypothetical protein